MLKILIQRVIRYFLIFIVVLFCIRLFEFWTLNDGIGHEYIISWRGSINDLSFSARIFVVLTLLQAGINFLFKRNFYFLLYIVPSLFLLIEWSLLEYFKSSELLLDEVLYSYSLTDIKNIAGGESISTTYVVGFFVLLLIYIGGAYLLKKVININRQGILNIIGILIVAFCFLPSTTFTKDENKNQFTNNKTAYFLWRTYFYYSNYVDFKVASSSIELKEFEGIDPNFLGGKSIDKEYPYFHELPDSSKFAQYLNPTSDGQLPNIVFLICEGLGTPFVGDYAYKTGRIMPFLDSLSQQSLYWPNFMSICDRTYQALPASLASVPIMRAGKMFLEVDYPAHFSLLNLLEKNYFSRFYCGHYLQFTNYDGFMNFQNTDYLVHDWEDQFSNKIDGKKSTWGYHEKELFGKSWLDYDNQSLQNKKRLDIFLTISTHPPYDLQDKEIYLKEAKALILENQKKYNEDYSYALEVLDYFVTYYYLDTQLKVFFEEAKKRPDFENTIFIIYGDHGTNIMYTDDISNYKTPLIIYSPLLKKPQKFLGVSSQLDLTPTLVNYLRTTYVASLPDKVTFVGKELSFSKKYENNRSLFLGTNERNDEFIMHDGYFMRHRQLFKMGKNLSLEKVDNPEKFDELYQQREYLRNLVTYTVYQDKFGPAKYIYKFISGIDKDLNQSFIKSFKQTEVFTKEDGEPIIFVKIGEGVTVDPKMKRLIVNLSFDYKSQIDSNYRDLPKFTFSLKNDKDSLLYFGHAYYIVTNDFQRGEWNRLEAKLTFDLPKELGKLNGDEKIKFKYYIFNRVKEDIEIKNSVISFYRED